MDKCVCEGNWRNLVKEYESLIGRQYKNGNNAYTFFGLVWSDDDFYFGMLGKGGKLSLLSCAGTPESFGYDLEEVK